MGNAFLFLPVSAHQSYLCLPPSPPLHPKDPWIQNSTLRSILSCLISAACLGKNTPSFKDLNLLQVAKCLPDVANLLHLLFNPMFIAPTCVASASAPASVSSAQRLSRRSRSSLRPRASRNRRWTASRCAASSARSSVTSADSPVPEKEEVEEHKDIRSYCLGNSHGAPSPPPMPTLRLLWKKMWQKRKIKRFEGPTR